MIQGNFIFPSVSHTQNKGDYYIMIKIAPNKKLGNTLKVLLSAQAMKDYEIDMRSRINVGFDDKGMVAIRKTVVGGWLITGKDKGMINPIVKNFPNMPDYMVLGYEKSISSTEIVYIAETEMLVFNTAIKGA